MNSLNGSVRPSSDEYFLAIARGAATRGTCARRKVGAVLVDAYNQILSTGYNGVASGLPHCIDEPCPGAGCKSGEGLHLCQALHAEANALIQCKDIRAIRCCYSTASPCIHCLRMLLNTSCEYIIFNEEYPHPESKQLWLSQGRKWIHYPPK